jgi:hypothetical protein
MYYCNDNKITVNYRLNLTMLNLSVQFVSLSICCMKSICPRLFNLWVVFGIDGLDRSDIEPGHVMEKNKVHSN